jgi:hypothetical protein
VGHDYAETIRLSQNVGDFGDLKLSLKDEMTYEVANVEYVGDLAAHVTDRLVKP